MQRLSLVDHFMVSLDQFLKTLAGGKAQTERPTPAKEIKENELSINEKKNLIGLMRINHTGEVCAQALYQGQALTTKNKSLARKFMTAAKEESDHLYWCEQRLQELGGQTSFLNPLWYFGSLTLGISAGIIGDRWSLGFLAETEQQVSKHLTNHLERIPKQDLKTKAILETMRADETQHATTAVDNGAYPLPFFIKDLMRFSAKIMTITTYYL